VRRDRKEGSCGRRQGFDIMTKLAHGTLSHRKMEQDALNPFRCPLLTMFRFQTETPVQATHEHGAEGQDEQYR
jgi:1,2-phenylacetyl-CoA epoxidase catalytic subunit